MKTSFYCIIILMLFSCSGKTKQSQITSDIVPFCIHLSREAEKKCPVELIASNIDFIPLETKKESFFNPQRIKSIIFNDSLLFLTDNRNAILEFNKDGHFLRTIGKKGNGPGEHGRIFDLEIYDNTLYVLSRKKVIKYGLQGNYIEDINLKSDVISFIPLNDKRFVGYSGWSGIQYFDSMGNVTDTIKADNDYYVVSNGIYKVNTGWYHDFIYNVDKRLYFNNYSSDTIWSVKNKIKEPGIILSTDDNKIPGIHPLEGDSLVVLVYRNNPNEFINVYNKNTKLSTCYETLIINDIILPSQYYVKQNKIISFLSYEEIKKQYDECVSDKGKMFMKELLDKLDDENSNPIMVVIDIK